MLGNITVLADAIADTADGFTARGTIWLGDYTIIENASLIARGGALNGSGLVSMISSADGTRRTILFRDSFDIDPTAGLLTPRTPNAEWHLGTIVGFRIKDPPTQLTLDIGQGQVDTTLNLSIVIPGNDRVGAVRLTLDHKGAVQGSLQDISFALGQVALKIAQASLGNDGFIITKASLELSAGLGGAEATLTATNMRITSNGQLSLGSAGARFKFPNIRVGGAQGFAIEGARADLQVANGIYVFGGQGTFVLPGVGGGSERCKVGTSFEFASAPPPLREASLAIDGCFKIPVANTGFFLTKVSGTVQLDEQRVAIELGIGIEGGPEFPVLGPALRGEPHARWAISRETGWGVGLSGRLTVFTFDVAEAALKLSQAHGLQGEIRISLLGVLEGKGTLHLWKDRSAFHLTGKQAVEVLIKRGAWGCYGIGICVSLPLADIHALGAIADFGEFRVGERTVYGLKGQVDLPGGYDPAFFVDVEGHLTSALGGLKQYQLVPTPGIQGTADLRQVTVAPHTVALLVGLAVSSAGPTLSLVTPDGRTLDASSVGVVATTTATETLLTVSDPVPGPWTIRVDNLSGEQYTVVALGAQPPATISAPSVTANDDGSYTIDFVGSSASPTATISLFYDTSSRARTGIPLVQELPLTTTSYRWQPTAVPSGTYSIYAMVDDPLGDPAFAYSPATVTISDSSAPDSPVGLAVTSSSSTAYLSWQTSSAADIAGYRVYYREPGGGATLSADIPDGQQTRYAQQGLYLNGDWEIAISAYDVSGNESARSAVVTARVYLGQTYLPIIQH